MKRNTMLRIWRLGLVLMLIALMVGSMPAKAQDASVEPGPMVVEADTAFADAPILEEAVVYDTPPALTEQQSVQIKWGEENAHRSPAIDTTTAGEIPGPVAGTEAVDLTMRPRSGAPLAPGDPVTYIWTTFGPTIPSGYKSNVMESSTDGKGQKIFYTGNWFAAYSLDKGRAWSYVDPFSGYSAFCCDQVVLHDVNRDIYIWERMASPDGSGNNTFKLSVSFSAPFNTSYWTYTFSPASVNAAWTNQWFDYPHMQLGADYLYISWNMFNAAGSWLRTLMLRFPLNELAAGAGFSYNYYTNTDWFTFVPVSGANHAMYFASNWDLSAPYDSLAIWRWYEDSASLTVWVKAVPAWTATGRGSMHCGTPNWLARGDQRLTTGARYEITNDGIAETRQPGRKVLGWWWNVAEGSGFTVPYINGAAFYEDTMTLLPGYLGRPYVYGSACFAYASFTANSRGDLGGVFNESESPNFHIPNVYYTIADDFYHAPPGWPVYGAAGGSAGPSDAKWGDYNTTRSFQLGTTWISGAHFIPTAGNCSNCSVPLWMGFGRERDGTNFRYW